ncbi:hypothetical protein ACVMYR_00595 [Micromonospora sp. PTRAS2]
MTDYANSVSPRWAVKVPAESCRLFSAVHRPSYALMHARIVAVPS